MSSSKLISRVSSSRRQAIKLGLRQQHSSSLLFQPRSLPPEHFENLNKLTNTLIDKQATPHRQAWNQTRILRGEQKALATAIQNSGAKTILSAQQTAFASSFGDLYDDDSLEPRDPNLVPGTFVEVRR